MSWTVSLLSSLAFLGYVSSQGYIEERRHIAQPPTIETIPKQFEIISNNPVKEFEKYASHIHQLAKRVYAHDRQNITIVYKVKVDVQKQSKQSKTKKYIKKLKEKKYNIPLKKNSMKLSNFEVFLRKAAEENNHYPAKSGGLIKYHQAETTEATTFTTKVLHIKFKPVISKLKKYSKVIKPVKNRIITL